MKSTEEHVRIGFRLPPLFLGKAVDYNFATAQTSYMVAEAQVFLPERTEFDETMNKTIIKELKLKTLKYKSKPITLKDVATQLKALELSKDVATRETFLKEMNTAGNMSLEMAEMPHPNVASDQEHPGVPTIAETDHGQLPAGMKPPPITSPQPTPEPPPQETPFQIGAKESAKAMAKEEAKAKFRPKEKKAAGELMTLVQDYAVYQGLLPSLVQKQEMTAERADEINTEIEHLTPDDAKAFNSLLAMYLFGSDDADLSSVIAATR